jgi:RNA polymerase sigma-70 factor (ECF subfamily)
MGRAQSRPSDPVAICLEAESVTEAGLDYTAFFRDEFPAILRTIELMLRDRARAEEITQDAFVQLYLNWAKVSRYDRPEAWVRRVAIRLMMRSVRRDRLWRLVRGGLLPSTPDRPTRYDLAGAIRQLSGGQRAAIVLHYYEDRPVAEVATILGCSESTARVQLHRGRRRLAQLLGEDDDGA